jgi:hypothetical protein
MVVILVRDNIRDNIYCPTILAKEELLQRVVLDTANQMGVQHPKEDRRSDLSGKASIKQGHPSR